jgi:hypothetical protein
MELIFPFRLAYYSRYRPWVGYTFHSVEMGESLVWLNTPRLSRVFPINIRELIAVSTIATRSLFSNAYPLAKEPHLLTPPSRNLSFLLTSSPYRTPYPLRVQGVRSGYKLEWGEGRRGYG